MTYGAQILLLLARARADSLRAAAFPYEHDAILRREIHGEPRRWWQLTNRPPVDRSARLAALVAVSLWASAFVGIRAVAPELSPGPLALGRLLIGTVGLGILVLLRPRRLPGRRDAAAICAAGVTWFAGYNVALNAGERTVDAGTASMLIGTTPLVLAILAWAFLGEGLPRRVLLGCMIGFAGVVVIGLAAGERATVAGAEGPWLCVLAALGAALGTTLEKRPLQRVSPLMVTWLACSTGALLCLPFGPALVGELRLASTPTIAWLGYLGLFPTAVAFTCWAFALRRSDAGRLGAITYLVPPIAVVLGAGLLGETPAVGAILGGGLCLVGVSIARSGDPRPLPGAGRASPSGHAPQAARQMGGRNA
jgi:drug/metabolite transporter (DMT)-like permease